jgi:hypothetical protein
MLPLILLTTTSLGAMPELRLPSEKPSVSSTQQIIERGVSFLEKDVISFMQANKCSACHHVPMALWSLHEAKRHNVNVTQKVLDDLQSHALASCRPTTDGKPAAKDKPAPKAPPNPMSLYVSVGVGKAAALDDAAAAELEKLLVEWIGSQETNGSWSLKNWQGTDLRH